MTGIFKYTQELSVIIICHWEELFSSEWIVESLFLQWSQLDVHTCSIVPLSSEEQSQALFLVLDNNMSGAGSESTA